MILWVQMAGSGHQLGRADLKAQAHDCVVTGSQRSLPLPASPGSVILHIASPRKIKIQSTVSTEWVSLLRRHEVEVEKLLSWDYL
jgi:hypothetical protein